MTSHCSSRLFDWHDMDSLSWADAVAPLTRTSKSQELTRSFSLNLVWYRVKLISSSSIVLGSCIPPTPTPKYAGHRPDQAL